MAGQAPPRYSGGRQEPIDQGSSHQVKILFAASRSWDDHPAVSAILDEVTGSDSVHIVSAYETRGAEAYAAEWVRERARLRRTSIDRIKAGKQFSDGPTSLDKVGTTMPERRARRDDYMLSLDHDLCVVLYRPYKGGAVYGRPLEIAQRAHERGIKTLVYRYNNTPRTAGVAL